MPAKKLKELQELVNGNDEDIVLVEDLQATKRMSFANLISYIKTKLGAAAAMAVANNLTTATPGSVADAQTVKKLNDEKAPNSHAVSGTTYGRGSASLHGHTMASSANPTAPGTANAGTDNGKYAREGHVHPSQTTLPTSRAIDGVAFDGSKAISHYVACSTAGATVAKAITLDGFSLAEGARVVVKFVNGIKVNNATLNVSGTGAKLIKYRGANLVADYVENGNFVDLIYDGTDWHIVSEVCKADISDKIVIFDD